VGFGHTFELAEQKVVKALAFGAFVHHGMAHGGGYLGFHGARPLVFVFYTAACHLCRKSLIYLILRAGTEGNP
jgi:hypothetical protein